MTTGISSPYACVVFYNQSSPISLFQKQKYKGWVIVGNSENMMIPRMGILDTCSGPNISSSELPPPEWLENQANRRPRPHSSNPGDVQRPIGNIIAHGVSRHARSCMVWSRNRPGGFSIVCKDDYRQVFHCDIPSGTKSFPTAIEAPVNNLEGSFDTTGL